MLCEKQISVIFLETCVQTLKNCDYISLIICLKLVVMVEIYNIYKYTDPLLVKQECPCNVIYCSSPAEWVLVS